jgi:hypothetical protein
MQPIAEDLLERLRANLDAGITIERRQEIIRLLVARITVTTKVNEDGAKDVHVAIGYRFPAVVATRTGTGAGQNYTLARRVIDLPVGRWPRPAMPPLTPPLCQGALP